MRSISTSSSRSAERGLFRLLVGAALAHAGWKAFWKWALPVKRATTALLMDRILKERYVDHMKKVLLSQDVVFGDLPISYTPHPVQVAFWDEVDHQVDATRCGVMRQAIPPPPPPVGWEKRKIRLRILWNKYRPVVMTHQKLEEREGDAW